MSSLRIRMVCCIVVGIGLPLLPSAARAERKLTPDELKFFETKIRPVLIRECYGCHSNQAGNVRGGLRLDTKELTLIGGSSGPAIVPGDPDDSFLLSAMMHEDFVMPPRRKLSDAVIRDFRKWIEMGAPDPRVNAISEIRSSISEEDIDKARQTFWAYQPPVPTDPPAVSDPSWPRNVIDSFVLARLDESEIKPAEDAEPRRVLRRLCFDLNGLLPTPEQMEYFTKQWSESPDAAIAHVVDRLLEKEQFGERWGRHWLDVVRYAESTGREVNMTYPHAWRYRDYVIDSLNADKPFDRFVQEQIAGDLLPAGTDEQWAEQLVATTFLAMGPKNVNEQNRAQFRADQLDEQIDATTRVFLGTSVTCARCHDHKFDAIPQTDYYALAGVFSNMETYFGNPPSQYGTFSSAQTRRTSSLLRLPVDDPNPFDKRYTKQELDSLKQEIEEKIADMSQSRRQVLAGENAQQAIRQRLVRLNQLSDLTAKLAVVDQNGQPQSYCMGVQEKGSPRDQKLLVRGEIDQSAQTVPRGFPKVLCSTPVELDSRQSGRLQLAKWIGSDANPLTARVMVNRIWQKLIGQGIVTSTENFGVTGSRPSHPELLDHLAVRFVEGEWSVKTLIREIAQSRSYRMASTFNAEHHEFDPDNALVWRANPRQLDAEAIRDAMLAVSGEIDLKRPRGSVVAKAGYKRVRDGAIEDPRDVVRRVAGEMQQSRRSMFTSGMSGARGRFGQRGFGRTGLPGFDRSQPSPGATFQSALRQAQNQLDMEGANFRSVYLPIVRDEVPRSLEVFDFADASSISGTRESSQTANQALFMMNNPLVIRLSDTFARRLIRDHSRTLDQIDQAFVLAYGRSPTSSERQASVQFLRSITETNTPPTQSLSALCQSLFASAEFRFVD